MPLPSPPFHEPEAIKHPVADGKEPSIGEILPVILGPNIIGSVKAYNMNLLSKVTGAFDYVRDGGGSIQSINGGIGYNIFNIDASRSSALYSTSETVQPSSLILNYVIKY